MPAGGPPPARPAPPRRFSRGQLSRCLPLVLISGLPAGCATSPTPAVEESVLDPLGTYELSMSSVTQVSDGTMTIRGQPGNYRGTLSVGVLAAPIAAVETGVAILNVHASLPQGTLILRLSGDGLCFAGNWVLGAQRGTITAEKLPRAQGSGGCAHPGSRRPLPSGGPVSTGRSSRPPHSDQDPS